MSCMVVIPQMRACIYWNFRPLNLRAGGGILGVEVAGGKASAFWGPSRPWGQQALAGAARIPWVLSRRLCVSVNEPLGEARRAGSILSHSKATSH